MVERRHKSFRRGIGMSRSAIWMTEEKRNDGRGGEEQRSRSAIGMTDEEAG